MILDYNQLYPRTDDSGTAYLMKRIGSVPGNHNPFGIGIQPYSLAHEHH